MLEVHELLKVAAQKKASDVFIKANSPPAMRISGRIQLTDAPPLTADDCRTLAYSVMTHEQIGRFEHRHELDLAFEVEGFAVSAAMSTSSAARWAWCCA